MRIDRSGACAEWTCSAPGSPRRVRRIHLPAYQSPLVSTPHDYVPIAIQTFIALGFVFGGLAFAAWLGPKKGGKAKEENFECGIEQYGNARSPFSIKYFLVAILFVLFDVEVIFLYPWAVNFKELGLLGFVEMVLFIGFVLAGFFYVIKKGALKWE